MTFKNKPLCPLLFFDHKLFDTAPTNEWLTAFNVCIDSLGNLGRHRCATSGKHVGVGQRVAYEKKQDNEQYEYKLKSSAKTSGHNFLSEKDPKTYETMKKFTKFLAEVAVDFLPRSVQKRTELMQKMDKEELFSEISPNLFLSMNFASAPHCDEDIDSTFGDFPEDLFAFGLWLEEHEPHCKNKRCANLWEFYFTEYEVRIPLCSMTFQAWNGKRFEHGTIYGETRNYCQSKVWGSASQCKRNFSQKFKKK